MPGFSTVLKFGLLTAVIALCLTVSLVHVPGANAYSETYCTGSALSPNTECQSGGGSTYHSFSYNRAANNVSEVVNIAMITAAGNYRGGGWFGSSYQARMCFVYDTPTTIAHAANFAPNTGTWYVDAVANNITYDSGCAV